MTQQRNADLDQRIRALGYGLLGPVIQRWLLGLHQYVSYFDDGDTAFLYCARAGVRIHRLYEIFVSGRSADATPKGDMFWISRVSVCKGTFRRNRERATEIVAHEYRYLPMSRAIGGLLRHHPDRLEALDLGRREHMVHGSLFQGWISSAALEAKALRGYFQECSDAFEGYVAQLMGARKRAVLIDSGWQGSAQSLLTGAFPEYDWNGLYFGRILTPQHDPSIVPKIIGILFEHSTYDPAIPESAFAVHRHIVETLLEPNGPSVEEIPAGPFAEVADTLISANRNEVVNQEKDRLFLHVCDYLRDHGDLDICEIFSRHDAAMSELANIIVTPSRDDALTMICKERSADFGKDLKVPVLLPKTHNVFQDPDARIQHALWPQGQIALEYDHDIARELQLRATGLADHASYFDPDRRSREALPANPAGIPRKPTVAVITRTKNRPVLLERAARSVAHQTYDSYRWVVVNDGGDENVVRDVIGRSSVDKRKISLVSNRRSLGMEAASNVGIRNSESDYILIHDDDDSLSPEFLARTVGYLESSSGHRYGGVITKSVYISEEINGGRVIEHDRHLYQEWVRNVQLSEMVCGNFFPPISFVFRRAIWEKVGGFNEDLAVLGDWYFNLQFLLEADIGVIHEPLAYYHHRDRGDSSKSGVYANSVIGGQSKHEEFSAIARNQFLRETAAKNPAALSIVLGYMTNEIRNQSRQLKNELSSKIETQASGEERNRTDGGYSERELKHLFDRADKSWIISHINRSVASKRFSWKRKKTMRPLSPLSGWKEILSVCERMELEIPIPSDFNEARYLQEYDDVSKAVEDGAFSSGYEHYVIFGRNEDRKRFFTRVD